MLKMTERILTLDKMKKSNLEKSHTETYAESMLQLAGDTIIAFKMEEQIKDWKNIALQRALIKNPLFAKLYQELLEGGMTNEVLIQWLQAAEEFGDSLLNYQAKQLLAVSAVTLPDIKASLSF